MSYYIGMGFFSSKSESKLKHICANVDAIRKLGVTDNKYNKLPCQSPEFLKEIEKFSFREAISVLKEYEFTDKELSHDLKIIIKTVKELRELYKQMIPVWKRHDFAVYKDISLPDIKLDANGNVVATGTNTTLHHKNWYTIINLSMRRRIRSLKCIIHVLKDKRHDLKHGADINQIKDRTVYFLGMLQDILDLEQLNPDVRPHHIGLEQKYKDDFHILY